jgi:hypothetical protein
MAAAPMVEPDGHGGGDDGEVREIGEALARKPLITLNIAKLPPGSRIMALPSLEG